MFAPEVTLDRYPNTETVSLAGLQESVVWALGSLGCPVDLNTILEVLPPDCRESFDTHARNMDFPGKPHEQPGHAFFEEYFVRFGASVTYVYGESGGYALSTSGQQRYCAIMGVDG